MAVLLTGCAGFIGMGVAKALLNHGERVIGIDSLNDYYDPNLKRARLAQLTPHPEFKFHDYDVRALDGDKGDDGIDWSAITCIVHLAAQPGVRYSLENPYAYVDANVTGQVAVLEKARKLDHRPPVVYASSSSVYGRNTKQPFHEDDPTDSPASLYAATKQSAERIAATYAHLYGLHVTGLRFFTVYGPWGRPDMAPYLFTKALLNGETIKLFNHGKQRRDFTYIDDIVQGVIGAIKHAQAARTSDIGEHRIYNLGNNRSELLEDFVTALEHSTGKQAIIDRVDAQPGDVVETYADISRAQSELGYSPKTNMTDGLDKFVAWYRDYHDVT